MVPHNSETLCLLEDTEVINEISFKLPSKFLAQENHNYKIPAFFDNNFEQPTMNIRIEAAKFEPEPTFEKTIHDIKDNHLKVITSAAMNISDITSFCGNFEQISMNSRIEVAKFETEPTFEKTINDIKTNHLKIITSIGINVSAITLNKPSLSSEYLKYNIMT